MLSSCLCAAAESGTSRIPVAEPWWKGAVIYEIFVRSFQDSNGDGIGDLNGITSRLDYLRDLGVDAIWLTPCYPSPLIDFGYDVADYKAIAPEYGTLADFDRLVAEARKRNIRIMLDLVLNHTSDKHAWFQESRASVNSAKRNWYSWQDGKAGGLPPNDWKSEFRGSAWTLDAATGQYYFHRFWPEQPDLNWRNPEVRNAMFDVVRFWLKRGLAGFRLDAVPSMFEDPNIASPSESFDQMPETHQVLRQLRAVVDEFPGDRLLLGETYTNNAAELASWYGKGNEIHLPLNFQFDLVNHVSAPEFRQRLADEQHNLPKAWPAHFLSSHDQSRQIDRYRDGAHDEAIAKLMATLLLTARGTPVMNYGEEIGMRTMTPTRVEDVRDMDGIRNWPEKKGRDGERTPMQWNEEATAGFSNAKPWLPVPPNTTTINVAAEQTDPSSLLNFYKQLTRARRSSAALKYGTYHEMDAGDPDILAFVRKDGVSNQRVLIVLNMSPNPRTAKFPALVGQKMRALVNTGGRNADAADDGIRLSSFGAVVLELK